MKTQAEKTNLKDRLLWHIKIRWWFVAISIGVSTEVAKDVFGIDMPETIILSIAAIIFIYNGIFTLYVWRAKEINAERFTLLSAGLDLTCLLILIHYTGGAENPFLFYFIFHTVLTSLYVRKKLVWLQTTLVAISVGALITLEYLSIIPHRHLPGFISVELYLIPAYLAAVYAVFTSSMVFTTYLAAQISERLKKNELELLEKDRLKSEYVMMVAHDIKSPLASIISILSVIEEGYSGSIDEKTRELLERVRRKTESLHGYAKDLLNLSRIKTSWALDLKPIDIKQLIDASIEIAQSEKNTKICVNTGSPLPPMPKIFADKEMLLHVLTNLISNAVKYTPVGGSVDIKANIVADHLELSIKDTGVGIPKDELKRIFDEFYRGSNVEKTTRGSGLGLSLVKYIVEKHSGTIEVESEIGAGTTVTVKLPIRGDSSI